MKKRLIALGMAGMMLLGALAGCGGTTSTGDTTNSANSTTDTTSTADQTSGDKKLKVAICMALRDQFLSTLEEAAKAKAKEMGVDLVGFDANGDISTQIGQVQTCATGDYDAVIVNLANTDSAQEVVNAAGDLPVAFVNRMPADASVLSDKVVYAGSKEVEAGTMQGEYLAKYFKDKGMTEANGVLIKGTLGLDNTNQRTDGVKKALEAGGIKVNWVFEDTADYDRAKAMDKMTQLLGDSSKKFDFVVCNADDMALGCIEAMKAAQGKVDVPVVGIDGGKTGCEAVVNGDMAFTVFQNPTGQAEGALECVVKLCKGESLDNLDNHVLWIPFEPVTKDNVKDYYQG